MTKTIVITGAFGFIGSHLATFLAEKREGIHRHTLVLVDHAHAITPERIKYVRKALPKAVVLTTEQLIGSYKHPMFQGKENILFHLGAVSDTTSRTEQLEEDNYSTVVDIAGFPGTIVFASSMSVYGSTQSPSSRGTVCPETPYALSKLAGENYLKATAGRPAREGTILARLANVFGIQEEHKGLMTSLPYKLWRNTPKGLNLTRAVKVLTSEDSADPLARDFVYVKRAVEALVAAAKYARKDEVHLMEVGTGIAVEWKDVASACLDASLPSSLPIDVRYEPEQIASGVTRREGYQRYTRCQSTGLLKETTSLTQAFADMMNYTDGYLYECDWGISFVNAIRKNIAQDETILRRVL